METLKSIELSEEYKRKVGFYLESIEKMIASLETGKQSFTLEPFNNIELEEKNLAENLRIGKFSLNQIPGMQEKYDALMVRKEKLLGKKAA